MPAVKTAVSMDKDLFDQAEQIAKEMKVTRSKLVAMALDEFVRRRQEQEISRQINKSYEDHPLDEEEKEFIRSSNASIAKLLEDDEW